MRFVQWVATAALGLGIGCQSSSPNERLRARVDCAGNPNEPAVDCWIQHLSGDRPANVCWQLRYECNNLTVVTGGEFCAAVEPGRRSERRIPVAALTRVESCDVPTSSEIRNVRVGTP